MGAKELLTREQMKAVFGGSGDDGSGDDGSGGCSGQSCPTNTYVCYCHTSNQFSCVYGTNIMQASSNFASICPIHGTCSANWDCN